MRILRAIETDGNPFWKRNEYRLVMIDTETNTERKITRDDLPKIYNSEYFAIEYYFTDRGIEIQYFGCGSGYGKVPEGERMLAIPRSEYDKLEIIESKEKREYEKNFVGNWRDNSDFEGHLNR